MIELRTGLIKTIIECPMCEKILKECKCEEIDYFDLKDD